MMGKKVGLQTKFDRSVFFPINKEGVTVFALVSLVLEPANQNYDYKLQISRAKCICNTFNPNSI